MEKHYLEKILEIFKKEKSKLNFTFDDKYDSEIIELFDLKSCNINSLRAIRDAVVVRLSDLKQNEDQDRFFIANIISYITTTIDQVIIEKGGQV